MVDLNGTAQLGYDALNQMLGLCPANKRTDIESLVDLNIMQLDRIMSNRHYNCITSDIIASWRKAVNFLEGNEALFGAILLCKLIVSSIHRITRLIVSTAIKNEFYAQLHRIVLDIKAGNINHMTLDNDIFLKDLGICRLEVFPCFSLLVDKNSGIPRRLAINNGISQFFQVAKLITFNGLKFSPYLEIHAHKPMIKNFNPEGWDRCYHLVADLLRLYPKYHGLIGGSWFFDPEIQQISPNLAYLRQRAQERGAYFMRIGSSEADVKNATAKSSARRILYEEKKYIPTGYLMIWPRKKLIDWSECHAKET